MARTAQTARRHFIRRRLRRSSPHQLRKIIRRLLRYIREDIHHFIPIAVLRELLGDPIGVPLQVQQGAPSESGSDVPPRALTSAFEAANGENTQT